MKRFMKIITALAAVCLAVILLTAPIAALAAEGYPPSPPDEGAGIAITVVVPRPELNRPAQTPAPMPEAWHIYPVHVWESTESGRREIIRVYELREDECSSYIPRQSFEREGFRFELAEITRREVPAHSAREHIEAVSISTQTNDLETVIRLLAPTLDYITEDGYFGVLTLDISSIRIESQGTRSSSFTATRTREFPHLSNPDTSLIPRTITENGRTYNLANVEWHNQSTAAVDYREVATAFTAVATYTRIGTSVTTIGYTTTAEYRGQVSRIAVGRTEFTARFIGIPIVTPIVTEPTSPGASNVGNNAPEPTPTPPASNGQNGDASGNGGNNASGNGNGNGQGAGYANGNGNGSINGNGNGYVDGINNDNGIDGGNGYENGNIPDAESDTGGFPIGRILIGLLFVGGIVLAYFAGKKGKAILSSMKKASCFLLAFVIIGGLLFGASQTVYAASIPRYGFGRSDASNTVHFDTRAASSPSGTTANAVHFAPSHSSSLHFAPGHSPPSYFSPNHSPPHFHSTAATAYNYGDFIGVLTVERLGRTINVIGGATMPAMDLGAGHFSFTGLNQGNTAMIGHNRGRTNGFFSFVRELREGDILTLEAGGIKRAYAVAMMYIICETDFEPLAQFGDNRLTLITCVEYNPRQRRIAVAFEVER